MYCGHCGGRIFASTARKSHHPTSGEPERITVYKCYNRTQHKEVCSGPTTYRAEKVDAVVSALIHGILTKAKNVNEFEMVRQQVDESSAELRQQIRQAKAELTKRRSELDKWESLMLDSIEGKCVFSPEQVKSRMERVQGELQTFEERIRVMEEQLANSKGLTQELMAQHQRLLSRAYIFDTASPEERKLIASQIIRAVTLSRDYEMQVEFNISEAQYLNGMEMG